MNRLLAGACVLLLSSPARADNIDRKLVESAGELVKRCRDHKWRNVGVLKFQVQLGKKAASLTVEPLCSNLADRVENALILGNDREGSLGVIRAAGEVAVARDVRATHTTAAGRKKLFGSLYPLAWGKQRVKPDAFLTGLAALSPDLKEVTVTITTFDAEDQTASLLSFTADVDRSVLADAGLGFAIARPKEESLTRAKLDRLAIAAAARALAGKGKTDLPTSELLEFAVLVNGKQRAMRPAPEESAVGEVTGLRRDDKLTFTITNRSKETLGVVLRVAGRSTIDEHQGEVERATKWVLEPGVTYRLAGYYLRKEPPTVQPFPVPPSPGKTADLAPGHAGMVGLFVFKQGGPRDEKVTDLRRLPPQEARATWTLAGLKFKLSGQVGERIGKVRRREIIVPDLRPTTGDPSITKVRFSNATCLEYRRARLVAAAK
jgi:hypothetical protein